MRAKFSIPKARRKHITSADVGRYLKQLAILHRDPLTGNVALSDALYEIAAVLIAARSTPATETLENHATQNRFNFEDEVDFHTLPLDKVREILARPDLTKLDLTTIGTERFGIAKSRMDRVPRDEIVKTITSALEHEESLSIISEEARRHTRMS